MILPLVEVKVTESYAWNVCRILSWRKRGQGLLIAHKGRSRKLSSTQKAENTMKMSGTASFTAR